RDPVNALGQRNTAVRLDRQFVSRVVQCIDQFAIDLQARLASSEHDPCGLGGTRSSELGDNFIDAQTAPAGKLGIAIEPMRLDRAGLVAAGKAEKEISRP